MATFRFRKCCVMLGICVCIPSVSAWAQQHYSLQNLLDLTTNYLPVLHQKEALINASKAALTDTRHSFLPQLKVSEQLNIGSDNSLAGSFFTFGITPSTSAGVRADNNTQAATGNVAVLYGEYELLNFGLNSAKIKSAQSYIDLNEADLAREKYLVQLEAARLYFNILKNQYQLNADKQNIQRYQDVFTVIHALTASGLKAGADSSLAKAELSKTRISYNQTQGRINQLKQQLSYLTGIDATKILLDTLSFTHATAATVVSSYAADTTNNPLFIFYEKKKAVFQFNETLIKKNYLPKVMLVSSIWARGSSIQFSDKYTELGNGLGYQRFNYAFGIAITYNLFNSIYRKDKLLINRYQTAASDFELQQQKLALRSSELQAENALQTAQTNLQELPVQQESALAVYQQKLAQYKAGLISLIDLTNASFVLYRSQTDYIETLSDWYLAQLDKAAATGNLIPFIQTIK